MLLSIGSVGATTEDFTTNVNITTGNGLVSFDSEDRDINLNCSITQSIPFTIVLQRDIVQLTCPNFINYSKISENQGDISLVCKGITNASLENALLNTLPAQFADQQAFFEVTVLPKQEELDALKEELNKIPIFEERLKNCENFLQSVNVTSQERIQDLRGEKGEQTWLLFLLVICVGLLILKEVVGWETIKKWTRGRR